MVPLPHSQALAQQQAGTPRRPVQLPPWFEEIDTAKKGFVTREEFIAHRVAQFDQLDADKDGTLSRFEFVKLAEPPFSPPPATPAVLGQRRALFDTQFSAIDTNDDGKLTREEFRVSAALSFREYDIDGDGKATREEVMLLERLAQDSRDNARKEHCRINPDCNGDGTIDLEEFVHFETTQMIERLDFDKDGKVTLQTFMVLAGPQTNVPGQPPYEQRRQQVVQRFNEIDANKDGVIDAAEIRAWATTAFKRLDLDGDGKLSAAEWQIASQPQTATAPPPAAPPPTTTAKPPVAKPAPVTTTPVKPPATGPRPVPPPPPPPTGLQPGAPLK